MDRLGLVDVWGVDSYPVEEVPEKIQFLWRDVEKEHIPHATGYFRIIHCGEVIEHVKDTDILLEEVHRLMSGDGVGFVTTPNLGSWASRIALLLGYQPYCTSVSLHNETAGKLGMNEGFHGQWAHIRNFTLRALKDLLRFNDFEIIHVEGWPIGTLDVHFDRGITLKSIGVVDSLFSKVPSLASRLAVVFRKRR